MIRSFGDRATQDVYHGVNSRAARSIPPSVRRVAFRKLDMIEAATRLDDLRHPPGNRLEALRGARSGFHSIRVNDQYRLVFRWSSGEADEVRILDYHS